jgi:hypothetical protein
MPKEMKFRKTSEQMARSHDTSRDRLDYDYDYDDDEESQHKYCKAKYGSK